METIPVTILGGSDHEPGPLPDTTENLHSLGTCKGAAISVGGKTLVGWLVEHVLACEGFGPVTIAGPRDVYEPLSLEAELLDTDASVGENLQVALDHHIGIHGPKTPMAVLTYDVLLHPAELLELRRQYEQDAPCAFWMPFVRKPENTEKLGAFGWKPTYRVYPGRGGEPIDILPGHLAVFRPDALEWPLLLRLLNLTYTTRNHSVEQRKRVLVRSVLFDLIRYDWKMITSGQGGCFTYRILTNGLRLARELRKNTLVLHELEEMLGNMFLSKAGRTDPNMTGIRHPLVEILALAEDVDTEEEARGVKETYSPGSNQ